MKNYVVKVLRYFKDKEEKVERKAGDEFETSKERYEFLKSKGAVELVEIIKEEKEEIIEEQHEEYDEDLKKDDEVVEEIITKKKKSSKK